MIEAAIGKMAEELASVVVRTGARKLKRNFLGTPAEQGMRKVYARAIASMLAEVKSASGEEVDPEKLKVAETVLRDLFSDEDAAALLLTVTLGPGPVPVAMLRARALELGYEPKTLPFVFEWGMETLEENVFEEFVSEARKERSPIQPLVNEELLSAVRALSRGQQLGVGIPPTGLYPPLPDLFVGREAALEDLKRGLLESSEERDARMQAITALRGLPGVGKTTVAAALIRDEEILVAFPDGVLWTSLGLEPDTLPKLLAWGDSLRPGLISGGRSVEEASGRLAALLRDKRVLLVVDDVWEAAHARPFEVGGPGCATLCTTRQDRVARALASRPESVHVLDVLSEEDAVTLFEGLAPQVAAKHPAEVRRLVRALDRLPLAVRVAAGLLSAEADAGLDVEELLEELAQGLAVLEAEAPPDTAGAETAREGSPAKVLALLRKSTDRLTDADRSRFACLGVFAPKPAAFDLVAAQAVWGRQGAEETVRALVARGLLEPAEPGRFQLHAVLRAYARYLLERDGEAGVAREARFRHATHYLAVLRRANELGEGDDDDRRQSRELFDRELDNVRAGQAGAAKHAGEDDDGARLCSDYAEAAARWHGTRLTARELRAWSEAGLDAARRLGDEDAEAGHHYQVGNTHYVLGSAESAFTSFAAAREIYRHLGNRVLEGRVVGAMAYCRVLLGDYGHAADLYREALRILDGLPDGLVDKAKVFGNLGNLYKNLGDAERAEEAITEAAAIFREAGDRKQEMIALKNFGAVRHYLRGDVAGAKELYTRALDVFRELHARYDEAIALTDLARAHVDLGEYEAAEERAQQGIQLAREFGDKGLEGWTLGILGRARRGLGDSAGARGLFERQLEVSLETGERRLEANALGLLGSLAAHSGDLEGALGFLEQRLEIAREVSLSRVEGPTLFEIASIHHKRGDYQEAVRAAEAALDVLEGTDETKAAEVREVLSDWRERISGA